MPGCSRVLTREQCRWLRSWPLGNWLRAAPRICLRPAASHLSECPRVPAPHQPHPSQPFPPSARSFQSPVEIPGVANIDFLRIATNARRKARGESELDPLEFYAHVMPKVG